MKHLTFIFLIGMLLPYGTAQAQCRMGSGPDHGDGIPYCSQLESSSSSVPSGPQWAARWGAIAYGGGGFGAATAMSSKTKATKAALRACRESGGGKRCQVALSYANQCAAYAIGEDYSVGVARSPDLAEAESIAVAACAESTSACKVTYSNCSLAARVK
jgi:Domain of unknown function (DUF4189)